MTNGTERAIGASGCCAYHLAACLRMRAQPLFSPFRPFCQALKLCPHDPLVANELGVLAYRNHQYQSAANWLQKALELVPGPLTASACSVHRGSAGICMVCMQCAHCAGLGC